MVHQTEDRHTELVEWILILNNCNSSIYLPTFTASITILTPTSSIMMDHIYRILNTIQDLEYGMPDEFISHFTSLDEFMQYSVNPDTPGVQFCQSLNDGTLILILFILFGWLARDSSALEKLSTFDAFKKLVSAFVLLYVVVDFNAIQQDIRILIAKDMKSDNCGIFIRDNLTGTALLQYVSISGNTMDNFQKRGYQTSLWLVVQLEILQIYRSAHSDCRYHNNTQRAFDSTAIMYQRIRCEQDSYNSERSNCSSKSSTSPICS